jgi:hypothetical protein
MEPPISVPIPKHDPRNPINAPSPPELPPEVNVVLNGFVVALSYRLASLSSSKSLPSTDSTVSLPLLHLPYEKKAKTTNIPIEITTCLQMHQTLRLRSPHKSHTPGRLQYPHNMRILPTRPPNPSHEPGIVIKIFETEMFFHADGHAV